MRQNKKTDGMNVFITNNAGSGQPGVVVLAYYSNRSTTAEPEYAQDWIVCIKSEAKGLKAATIAHEAGHMFTLPHTFFGFEEEPFCVSVAAPCAPASKSYGGSTVLTEKAARTGADANCTVSADGFCDTEADYNFGLIQGSCWNNGANSCVYNGGAKDPTCVTVNPEERNLMSYFNDCVSIFSPQQSTAMRTNYNNHAGRAYLRNGNVAPSFPGTMALPVLQTPAHQSTTQYFNNINFDWADVQGAIGYIIEVSTSLNFAIDPRRFLTTNSSFSIDPSKFTTANYLTAGRTYYWRVRPYGNYVTCAGFTSPAVHGSFTTGVLNSAAEIKGVSDFTVQPNPVSKKQQKLSLSLATEKGFDAQVKVISYTGQVVLQEEKSFTSGFGTHSFDVSALSNGIYVLQIESNEGVLNKKVVVID
jgi:hypothetical protein